MAIFTRRIAKFNSEIDIKNLDTYFNIINTPEQQTTISSLINEDEKTIALKITYNYNNIHFNVKKNNIRELPQEINDIIQSYLEGCIEINTLTSYDNEYPFSPPQWNLTSVLDKTTSSCNLKEYYTNIVKCHNNQYLMSWSAAIYIEKDILIFIARIADFEHIINI